METLLRFTVGGKRFGLPLKQVGEMAEAPEPVAVPGAPLAIAGIVDFRGRIVTLVDLVRLLDLPREEPSARRHALILAEPLAHLALLIDGDVRIDSAECRLLDVDEILDRCSALVRESYRLPV